MSNPNNQSNPTTLVEDTSFPKEKIKILLLEGIHQNAVKTFERAGYTNVELLPKALPKEELIEKIASAFLIGIRSKTHLTADVLAHANKLLGIGCFCIGTNQVDLEAAAKQGIGVFNSPYSNTRSVAELVVANTVMLMRGVPQKSHAAHEGLWLKSAKDSYEVRGKSIGIIGYGHIGSQVSILAEAMGMRVFYYDIEPKLPLGNATALDSLEELLSLSDVVTLHVPEDPSTINMIGATEIGQMKEGAYLLNLSRGTVVDIPALSKALKDRFLHGAAIDVFPKEPRSKEERFSSELQGLENVILTPHIGGSTMEAQENIGKDAAFKLINFLDRGITVGCHTIPELNLPIHQNTHRILHVHKNEPGVLGEINGVISKQHVNILGQYLKTKEEIGYVVLDIEKTDSNSILEALKGVKHTIKARILY